MVWEEAAVAAVSEEVGALEEEEEVSADLAVAALAAAVQADVGNNSYML